MTWLYLLAVVLDIVVAVFIFGDFLKDDYWGTKLLSLFFCAMMLLGAFCFMSEFADRIANGEYFSIEAYTEEQF